MPLFKTLSQLVHTKQPTLTADDLAAMVPDARSVLLDQEFLVPARTATHVTCDACYDDHVEEVTRIKNRNGAVSFRIFCPEAGWVDVLGDRLRQWTVDVRRLVTVLSAAVGTGQSPEELVRESVWRLGTVEIAGEPYDVVFVRVGDSGHEPALDQLARKHPPSRTLVVASRDPPESSNGFAAVLPLPTAFLFTAGRVEFQFARVRSVVSAGAMVDGNVFRLRGEFWQLSFDSKTVFIRDSVGMGYIARLLMEPNVSIPAVTLLAARAGIDPLVAAGSSGEILDDETRKRYGTRYRELVEDLAEAKANNDLGRIEKLESELEDLTNELASATGLGGRSRQKSDFEKVRKAVSMAVTRDIERIGKRHESLGRHLDTAIDLGATLRYAPEGQLDWLI